MKVYWVKTRWFIRKMFPDFVWNIPNNKKEVYLTFDDGPVPEITEWVLDILKQYEVTATFFCIGNNIERNPDVFKKVVAAGHAIGNHTFNHLNGWNTTNKQYAENIVACEKALKKQNLQFDSTKLFRPPYGRLKAAQAAQLRKDGYKIVMWDVLSADFDQAITPEQCLKNVIENTQQGSVIIFHDSVKAFANLEYALPRAIEYLKEKNFRFGKIA